MLIVCSTCVSAYRIEPAAAAGSGTALWCAHCRGPLPAAATSPSAAPEEHGPERSALRGIAAVVLLLGASSAALLWREPLARAVPGAAGLYRLAGLPELAPAEPVVSALTTVLTPDGLRVEGRLANPRRTPMALPRLRLTLRDEADGTLASWVAAPPKPSLAPGETVTFTSHLDKPPAGAHDLAVSFSADRVAVSKEAVGSAR